ncbi:8445_t:CDS:2, partial [Racocetra persica]
MWKIFAKKRVAYTSIAVVVGSASAYYFYPGAPRRIRQQRAHSLSIIKPQFLMSETYADAYNQAQSDTPSDNELHTLWVPPSRKEMLNILKSSSMGGPLEKDKDVKEPPFDLLIIGGGATGTGTALDAATRGLKVALVERDDFSAGTSSRSTKLVHGGVRYLEKAFKELDYGQYKLVKEALHERATFLHIAPYLSYPLPILLPIYKWWQVPYFWVGSKVYDFLAGRESMESSHFLSSSKAIEAFPWLKKEKLVGAMVYYD